MARDKSGHHELIMAAAWQEFLTYGFADASMRRIASSAGMSVSGLYKHFAGKEKMFAALVDPACQGLLDMFHLEADDREQFVGAGNLDALETGQDAKLAIAFIYDHLDAFRLIICKSQGTKYESFPHDLAVLEEKVTLSYMDTLKKQGVKLNEFNERELHLLTSANVNAVFQAVEHGFTREEAMHYADTLDRFFSSGWRVFFGY
jgi:AcrR family transcriptional regulator